MSVLLVLPFILGYTFWSYRIFRGKATGEDPYG
jgi:cytochrome bd-type quinol oxidase subunit 2